jgi:hypothetical protein
MDPWEVMPAPFGLINPGRESGKTEWHWSWLSGVNLGRKLYFFANVRDHRWLPVARLVPGEERAQARGVTRVAIRWIALFGWF